MLNLIVALVMALSVTSARADEQMRTLAASGSWVAIAHQESLTAEPDVCLVATPMRPQGVFAFRHSTTGTELRISNDQWSLPSSVSGTVKIAISSLVKEYDIGANTFQTVSVLIPDADVADIFAAMDKYSSMSVTVGKAKPVTISLIGSTKATNAFRSCSNIESVPPQSSGANPFSGTRSDP